ENNAPRPLTTRHCSMPTVIAVMKTVCTRKAITNFVRKRTARLRRGGVSPESMDGWKCNAYHRGMPLIRCAKVGQAYDVPGAIAVHLPNSIATCQCGEWLAGSKSADLARLLNPDEVKEIDLMPYKNDQAQEAQATPSMPMAAPGSPQSIRVI